MPKDGEIDKPSLRVEWEAAKEAAKTKAKALDKAAHNTARADKLKQMTKTVFKLDLGPSLDKWFKPSPDIEKIRENGKAIDIIIAKYKKAVTEAKDEISTEVAVILTKGLKQVEDLMESRLKALEILIQTDEEVLQKYQKIDSKKPQIRPIKLYEHFDVTAEVVKLAKIASAKFNIQGIVLDLWLDDPKVLATAPDDQQGYALLAQEMRDAADKYNPVQKIAAALDDIAKDYKGDVNKAAADFDKAIERILEETADAAGVPFTKLAKVKVDRTKYKVKQTATLALKVGGLAASIVSLATVPFTGGASGIISIAGIITTSRGIGVQIGQLAQSAEQTAGELAENLGELLDHYQDANKNRVGVEEIGRRLANELWPGAIKSISGCKDKCDLLKEKIGGITVHAHEVSDKLGVFLDKQTAIQKQFAEFEKSAEKVLTNAEVTTIQKLIKSMEGLESATAKAIEQVSTLYQRAQTTSNQHEVLSDALTVLAAKEPTWAQIGEVVMSVAVSAGFLIGGNVNAPDPYKMVKLASDVTTGIANGVGSFTTVVNAMKEVEGIVKDYQKKHK